MAVMRRVVKWHHDYKTGADKKNNPMGEKLYTAFGVNLSLYPWSKVNRVRLDLSPKEQGVHDAAAKLARALNSRMPMLRTMDPEVTARALWLYDRDMCRKLAAALEARIQSEDNNDEMDIGEGLFDAVDDMGA